MKIYFILILIIIYTCESQDCFECEGCNICCSELTSCRCPITFTLDCGTDCSCNGSCDSCIFDCNCGGNCNNCNLDCNCGENCNNCNSDCNCGGSCDDCISNCVCGGNCNDCFGNCNCRLCGNGQVDNIGTYTEECDDALDICCEGCKFKDNCCKTNEDCDDGDSCTNDMCILTTGECINNPVLFCCFTKEDCTILQLPSIPSCFEYQCKPIGDGTKQCLSEIIEGCCFININCVDGDPLTLDTCVDNICVNTPISICGNDIIEEGEECDDETSCCKDCKLLSFGDIKSRFLGKSTQIELFQTSCITDETSRYIQFKLNSIKEIFGKDLSNLLNSKNKITQLASQHLDFIGPEEREMFNTTVSYTELSGSMKHGKESRGDVKIAMMFFHDDADIEIGSNAFHVAKNSLKFNIELFHWPFESGDDSDIDNKLVFSMRLKTSDVVLSTSVNEDGIAFIFPLAQPNDIIQGIFEGIRDDGLFIIGGIPVVVNEETIIEIVSILGQVIEAKVVIQEDGSLLALSIKESGGENGFVFFPFDVVIDGEDSILTIEHTKEGTHIDIDLIFPNFETSLVYDPLGWFEIPEKFQQTTISRKFPFVQTLMDKELSGEENKSEGVNYNNSIGLIFIFIMTICLVMV